MPTFIIEQKITAFANQYRVYGTDESGKRAGLMGFAHQKRLALKEKFEIFADEAKSSVLFTVKARQVMDLGARYDITTPDGASVGVIGKQFGQSLLRSTWSMFIPGQETAPALTVQERSLSLAIIRRVWEFIPIASSIPFFVRYHFDFVRPDGTVVGTYSKTSTLLDHYRLTINEDVKDFDPRAFIAMGIMLDALQSR